MQKKKHEKNNLKKNLIHALSCRRGSRTTHDAVSQRAKFGGQPQSELKNPFGFTLRLS